MKRFVTWLSVALLAAMPLLASGEETKKQKDADVQAAIDAKTGKAMNAAIEALNANKYAEAEAKLADLDRSRLSPYEIGRIEQILASVSSAKNDYNGAQKHLQAAIDSGGVNPVEADQMRYQIAQLFLAMEKWRDGRDALKKWFATTQTKPNASAYYLLAVANYQLEDMAAALQPAKQAVDMSENPQKSWVELLLALYMQQQQYGEATPLLKKLISQEPKKQQYWNQLSGVYRAQEKYNEALSVMELMKKLGLVTTDSDSRTIADLAVFSGIPYRGAQHLEKAMNAGTVSGDTKNFERLAQAWTAAREYEKSAGPLQKAAERSGNGDLFVRLAQVNIQQENWAGATAALDKALSKGGLRDTGAALLLMGISQYSQKKNAEARTWFEKATKYPNSAKAAEGWLKAVTEAEGNKA